MKNVSTGLLNIVCLQVSHTSIQADRDYALGPFEKGKFLVWFEPVVLGVQNCKVSFHSVVAGEFVYVTICLENILSQW